MMRFLETYALLASVLVSAGGPAAAGIIQINAVDIGDSSLVIGYQVTAGSELPVAFGLDITLTGPATVESVEPSSHFPIHPGTLVVNPVTGHIEDYGSPVAPAHSPAALGGLNTSGVTIEMAVELEPFAGLTCPIGDINGDCSLDNRDLAIFGNQWLEAGFFLPADLNRDGQVNFFDYPLLVHGGYNDPPFETNLLLMELDGNGAPVTTVTISPNLVRGGIVDGQGLEFVVIWPQPLEVVVPEPATVCLLGLGGLALLRGRRQPQIPQLRANVSTSFAQD